MSGALEGRRIVVPESRELDLFVAMLERAGAQAIRCPLVSIHDSDDTGTIEAWLRRLVAGVFDDLLLYTGEGLRRLLGFARRAGFEAEAVAAVGRTRRIVRGPKPSRVLRTIGLGPDLAADPPTTEGLVAAFAALPMAGRHVGIQLYPECPDTITRALEAQGASVDAVLPYRYASHEEDGRVVETLNAMAAGEIDVIALTSSPQVRRIVAVAKERGMQAVLARACSQVLVAAVGPITAEAATAAGWRVAAMPETNYHLKPFIAEIAAVLASRGAQKSDSPQTDVKVSGS